MANERNTCKLIDHGVLHWLFLLAYIKYNKIGQTTCNNFQINQVCKNRTVSEICKDSKFKMSNDCFTLVFG